MKHRFLLLIACGIFLFASCSDDDMEIEEEETCGDTPVSYSMDIKPLVLTTCALGGCHVSGFASGDFTKYDDLKEKADNGRLLARAVVQRSMPPSNSSGPSLSNGNRELIECWIDAGAPNN